MATALQRVYEQVRVGQAVFRDANRFREIVTILARHGFGAFVESLHLQDRWLINKLAAMGSREAGQLPFERRMLKAIQELGPTFVKLGQILSTRPDIVPPALVAELKTLQDAVPPMTWEEVDAQLKAEIGADWRGKFSEFSEKPLACASIAQVHRAVLKDGGHEVVVKVQRPNIQGKIEADVEIMGFLARALEANFPETRLFSPAGIVEEFEKAILKEIDFTHESGHIERFQQNFRNNPAVHFPRPYKELSTPRVFVMEFIRGTKITSITPDRFDVAKVVDTGLNSIFQMIYQDGFFHGDLHPGNLLVRDDNVLCFIDFGLCGRLSQRQRDQLIDVLIAIVRQDYESVARTFWKIGIHGKDTVKDYGVFEADVVEMLDKWFTGKTLDEIEFGGLFKDLIEGAMRHRLRMPPDYTMTFKAVITMEGVGRELQPGLDVLAKARPFITAILKERYSPEKLLKKAVDSARELAEIISSFPQTVQAIMEDLRKGETQLNIELTQARHLQRTYAKTQSRNMYAVMASAAAISGTLALPHDGYAVLGFPAVSFWFYLLTVLLGAGFFLKSGGD
ncbi:MAG: AarF/ABC1/UbiB kinase family protein [Deltaproteobacteria bacterium]|nr:AarF/ABC1/UbiB kinase family protein [Deltaproteobacteria bacterium]